MAIVSAKDNNVGMMMNMVGLPRSANWIGRMRKIEKTVKAEYRKATATTFSA